MTDSQARVTIPGSERKALPGAADATPIDPTEQITVTVVLRRKAELPEALVSGQETVTPEELAERYGASESDVDLVRAAATAAGVTVESVDLATRRVVLAGAAPVLAALFGTTLVQVESPDPTGGAPVSHRHRQGSLSVPASLGDVVVAVLGLDDRPQTKPRLRRSAAATKATSFTPTELAVVYGFPAATTGAAQTLAIIELGGGYADKELATYFTGLGVKAPTVTAVGVDGGRNVAGKDPDGADGEVLLDVEVAGALAPGAEFTVYFAPNTDQGFLDAVSEAGAKAPTAISISWGQSEDDWTEQARSAMDSAFADAAALGVTVTVAAGDDGSTDRASDGQSHVDFPASSPHVLACGGTKLTYSGKTRHEVVWNEGTGNGATGGGISDSFARPDWQAEAGVPATGRGVPDVAAVADPESGYQVLVDGKSLVIGGTSAVAPLWAALVCRLAEGAGKRFGLLAPLLYEGVTAGHKAVGFHDITSGNNGAYKAGHGWDACTGLGVPDGAALLKRLSG